MKHFQITLAVLVMVLMTSCAVVSKYDQNSYESAKTLKSESIALVPKAKNPAIQHTSEIEALKVKLSAQLAYEEGKGKQNVISAKQWDILISENHDLLGKLLKQWQDGKTFSPPYLREKGQQIGDAFDQILRLEAAKEGR